MIILIIQRNSWNSFFLRSSNDSKIFLIALTRSKGHHLAILIPVINFSRYNGNINPPKKTCYRSCSFLSNTITVRSRYDHETPTLFLNPATEIELNFRLRLERREKEVQSRIQSCGLSLPPPSTCLRVRCYYYDKSLMSHQLESR